MLGWLEGRGPGVPMEAVHPEFATQMGRDAATFTFDEYAHAAPAPGWSWAPVDFPGYLSAPFQAYRPDEWNEVRREDNSAQLLEDGAPRQTWFLLSRESWVLAMREFLKDARIQAFDFRPFDVLTSRWIFVTADDTGFWCWAVYASGDWLVSVKADAADRAMLTRQLTSLSSMNLWHGPPQG